MFRKLCFALALIAGVFAGNAPAWAGLHFRNRTGETVYVAVAYAENGNVWEVRGWYGVAPGHRVEVVTGDLNRRYYYYNANSASHRTLWEGSHYFYVHPTHAFNIHRVDGVYRTLPYGATMKGFRTIDTGQHRDFTLNLNPSGHY